MYNKTHDRIFIELKLIPQIHIRSKWVTCGIFTHTIEYVITMRINISSTFVNTDTPNKIVE